MRVFATLVYSLPDFRRKERARDVQTRKRRGPAVLNVFACFARFTLGFFLPSSQNLDALSFFFFFRSSKVGRGTKKSIHTKKSKETSGESRAADTTAKSSQHQQLESLGEEGKRPNSGLAAFFTCAAFPWPVTQSSVFPRFSGRKPVKETPERNIKRERERASDDSLLRLHFRVRGPALFSFCPLGFFLLLALLFPPASVAPSPVSAAAVVRTS